MNRPDRALVKAAAERHAEQSGVSLDDILGPNCARRPSAARFAAWREILAETGCSVNGLATVWGCDRQAIRRAMNAKRLAEQAGTE